MASSGCRSNGLPFSCEPAAQPARRCYTNIPAAGSSASSGFDGPLPPQSPTLRVRREIVRIAHDHNAAPLGFREVPVADATTKAFLNLAVIHGRRLDLAGRDLSVGCDPEQDRHAAPQRPVSRESSFVAAPGLAFVAPDLSSNQFLVQRTARRMDSGWRCACLQVSSGRRRLVWRTSIRHDRGTKAGTSESARGGGSRGYCPGTPDCRHDGDDRHDCQRARNPRQDAHSA